MKKYPLLFVLIALVALVATAFTEDYLGPEDDPYLPEVPPSALGDRPTAPATVMSAEDGVVTEVVLSSLDCGMFPTMCSYVEVLDDNGDPMGGMDVDSFCVYQDGVPINLFTVEEISLDECHTSVCLVIDVSGSMNDGNKIGGARNAAHAFVNNMDIYDRVAIVTFSTCYTVVQDFTSDQSLLHTKINTISAQGWTAVFDGIYKGVDLTIPELGSKAVIAISDGMENSSQNCDMPPDGLRTGHPVWSSWDPDGWVDDSTFIVDHANGSGIPIYTISLGSEFDPQYLVNIAAATGGSYSHAPTAQDIQFVYEEIKNRLCSRYIVCYTSPDVIQDGDWHTMTVCYKNDMGVCGPCDEASCQETAPPVIVRTQPTIDLELLCQPWEQDVDVCANVTDLDTPQEDLVVRLFYRSDVGESFVSATMTRTGSLYCATIPGAVLACDRDEVEYYITASDGQVTVASPALAPVNVHAFDICQNQPPVVSAGADQTISQCTPAQICWSASASDPDNNLGTTVIISGPGTFDGSQICFTPTGTLDYEIVLQATDLCGLQDVDTVVVHYSQNSPPVADAGSDQSLFLCGPQEVCWPASCTDVDGNLSTCTLISGPGTYDGTNICFTPSAAGNYSFTLEAVDACGASHQNTVDIEIAMNSAPVCTVPDDATIFQCLPTQVCLPISATDVDGNLKATPCQVVSGPGSLVGGNWCYTPTGDQVVTVTVRCEDDCDASCEDQFTITFDVNDDPTISFGADYTEFLCTSQEICLPFTAADPDDGQATTVTLLSGPGTLDVPNSEVCFTPGAAGDYTFDIQITDSCGAAATDQIVVSVEYNSAPVASAGADQTLFLCGPEEICWPASCSDVDGNLTDCALIAGPGTYDGTDICFTPSASGDYLFTLQATDACGETHTDDVTISVTMNSAPSVVAQADLDLFMCVPTEVCVTYTPSDPDGLAGLTETMISGYGNLDAANDRICFTPTATGSYEFTIGVTDPCGATAQDVVIVDVQFGDDTEITCPVSAFDLFLCGPQQVDQALTVAPDSARVSLSYGTFAAGVVSFLADTAGTYEIDVTSEVECATDNCTLVFNVTMNTAPVANAGPDQNLFLCGPEEICWPASCSDVDGNLTACALIAGPGTYDGSQICFTPSGAGNYVFTLQATDACGATHTDDVTIAVGTNSVPSVAAQADLDLFMCVPTEVCVTYTPSDPDGLAGLTETMISGYGNLDAANDRICFTPTASGSYEFIIGVTDPCGETAQDVVVVDVTFGDDTQITCPASAVDLFLCSPQWVDQATLSIAPDSARVSVSYGTYAAGVVSFLADTAGTYEIDVTSEVECATDNCTLVFNVTMNSAPVASAGADQNLFLCGPEEICWPASCSDVDGNLTDCALIAGPGTYDGSQICFTPSVSGDYLFTLQATDACGEVHTDDVTISVTMNSAPSVVAQADLDLFMCDPTEVCVTYTPSDPDGLAGLTETMISGHGTLDAANDRICFTPSVSGSYEFVIGVSDPCGLTAQDVVIVDVEFGEAAVISCPASVINVNLCAVGEVCQLVDIQPSTASVSVSMGTFINGEHCFTPTASGIYNVRIIATDACGADTCDISYDVDIGSVADIECPPLQTLFICDPGEVCIPVPTTTPGATFVVSPIGYYNSGAICFDADTSGHYVIDVTATTSCGSDACQVIADITINSAPVATDPASPIDLFVCDPQPVCYQFAATDVNGGDLTWSYVSGSGTVSPTGQWCFDATVDGAYTVVAKVTDECGATDQVTLTYNIDMNAAPTVALGPDASIFLCDGDPYCFNYTASDADGNLDTEVLLSGPGTLNPVTDEICFTPTGGGIYTFVVEVTDACGATAQDEINITVDVGTPVTVTCPPNDAVFLCVLEELCYPVTVSHPDAVVNVSHGSYDALTGQLCFTPPAAGHYDIVIDVSNACGTDQCQFGLDVTVNSAPVADDPTSPIDLFLCNSQQVCYQFTANDVDGGNLVWSKVSGNGTVSATGEWCFDATADGSYSVVADVTDPCGETDQVTLMYNIDLNSAPTVGAGADHSIFLCDGQSYCFNYTTGDDDDNLLTEVLLQGTGTIDPLTNEVCFTPTTGGVYTFVVQVTDECGATAQDEINITVDLGTSVSVSCPADDAVFLCSPEELCYPITLSHPSATVTVTGGTYNAGTGEVCFTPGAAGHYDILVEVENACGTDQCQFGVDVTFNSPPVADDPGGPIDLFLCQAEQVCYQFTASDVDGGDLDWSRVSGNGSVDADGLWCFTPSATGAYTVVAQVVDACGATDQVTLQYNVTFNTAPVVVLEDDATVFICGPTEFCYSYTVTDPDDNVLSETLTAGTGTLDDLNNTICFTASTPGVFGFTVEVVDECGAIATDDIQITVEVNQMPVVDAGVDQDLFLCESEQVCVPVSCSDPDANLDLCEVIQGDAQIVAGSLCFTPTAGGVYDFIVQATDACGETAQDDLQVTITMNTAPACGTVDNQTFFQCAPEQVTVLLGVTDVDDNFDYCEITQGPGSIVNGSWVHTPTGNEIRTVVIRCYDECGDFCEIQFDATFIINSAPVADAGEDFAVFLCEPGEEICWPVSCTDPDDNLSACTLDGPGTLSNGEVCFTPGPGDKTYRFILRATDECGLVDVDSSYVTIDYNEAPTISVPSQFTAFLDAPGQVCFGLGVTDPDDHGYHFELISGDGVFELNQICFDATGSGTYCFEIRAWDDCGAETFASVCAEIEIDECLSVQIEKAHGVLQGHQQSLDILLNGSGKPLGGFDILLAYDQSAMTALAAFPGELYEQCGWEYFTYRLGADGQCDGCPTGLFRITAIADLSNGAYHPSCYWQGMIGSIAEVRFLISNDRTLECQFAPVYFYWLDCNDNAFSSQYGDTLWLSREVFDFEGNNMTNYSHGFPGAYGAPDYCMVGDDPTKAAPIRCVDFTNGGFDIICADSIDARGDINLNAIPFEIADAVTYTNYFISGLAAFTVSVEGQIAASDTNADGLTLTVADLVYLIRVITGDVSMLPKEIPQSERTVKFAQMNDLITIVDAAHPIGAVHLVVSGQVNPTLHENAVGMELKYDYDGERTRILVYDRSGQNAIVGGPVLKLGYAPLVEKIEAASYDGQTLTAKLAEIPYSFELQQNYPNPFNPTATIKFGLPVASEWRLDIFNILGQRVDTWSGQSPAGFIEVIWDASPYASGVYFYRLSAGDFSKSLKMVLLK